MIWKLTKLSYLGGGGITSHLRVTTKKENAAAKLGTGVLLAFLGIYFVYLFFSSATKMIVSGQSLDYAAFFLTIFILEFFFLFSSSDNVFFKSEDLQLLSTLPVTRRQLFISRVNLMLIEGYMLSIMSYIGCLIATLIFAKLSVLWLLSSFVFYMAIPLFLTTISALLSLFLSEKPAARKIKRMIYYIILIAFFYVYMTVYIEGMDYLGEANFTFANVIPSTISWLMIALAAIFVLFFLLALPLMERKFLFVSEEESKKVRKEGKVAARSTRSTLMHVEWDNIINESSYSVELLGEVLMPVILIVLFGAMGVFDELNIIGFLSESELTPLLVLVTVTFISSMNGMSSTSFSREGKDYYLLESLPISRRERFLSKYFFHLLMFMPFDAVVVIVIGIFMKMPIWFYPIAIACLFFYSSLSALVGLKIDSNAPYLDWARPQMAVKNNMNMLKGMGILLVIGAICFLPGLAVLLVFGGGYLPLLIPTALLAIFYLIILKKVIK